MESLHIPFIRPIWNPRPKYPHPPLPTSQLPTLWSVSRFQTLTEVEDINSEGSYCGEEGEADRAWMSYIISEKDSNNYYFLENLDFEEQVKEIKLEDLFFFFF